MRYRSLGGTGTEVSVHSLGTMMFGAVGNPDHEDCVRIIHAALDQSINFVDTADMYSAGESEEIAGKALKGRRDDVVLATKVYFQMGEGHNRSGNSRRFRPLYRGRRLALAQGLPGSIEKLTHASPVTRPPWPGRSVARAGTDEDCSGMYGRGL
jgi:aryl-alcohol dehydrogenase-like predicted oxidoreductase